MPVVYKPQSMVFCSCGPNRLRQSSLQFTGCPLGARPWFVRHLYLDLAGSPIRLLELNSWAVRAVSPDRFSIEMLSFLKAQKIPLSPGS